MPDIQATPPPYPEYPALLAEARRTTPRFVSPPDLAHYRDVVRQRGSSWCTAVLGRPFLGLRHVTSVETQLLVLADERDLDPPPSADAAAARERHAANAARLEERRAALRATDTARWEPLTRAAAAAGVDLEVRPNTHGRRLRSEVDDGPLRHAVPTADALSGPAGRPRRHPAGRPVCETSSRARPRTLGDPTDHPATCVSCLTLTPQLRPADHHPTPGPDPTAPPVSS